MRLSAPRARFLFFRRLPPCLVFSSSNNPLSKYSSNTHPSVPVTCQRKPATRTMFFLSKCIFIRHPLVQIYYVFASTLKLSKNKFFVSPLPPLHPSRESDTFGYCDGILLISPYYFANYYIPLSKR